MPRIAWIFVLLLVSPASAGVRVALVTTSSDKAARQIIDLVTAELSSDADITLLDRESIDAVVKEQRLSLSGVVDGDKAIRVGQLLQADLLAVIDDLQTPATKSIGVVVFDPNTGLRLSDDLVAGSADSHAIADAVRSAIKKDRTLGNGLKLIGFLPVRNVDLPPEWDQVCETVHLLLESQLTGSPDIAVLERGRLEAVNEERLLPTTRELGKLRPSVILVQLNIGARPVAKRGLKAEVVLLGDSGKPVDKFEAVTESNSAADLAEALEEKIMASLNLHPSGRSFNRHNEAMRFLKDSEVLLGNDQIEAGAQSAEAAYALFQGKPMRWGLSNALWMRAGSLIKGDDVRPENLDRSIGLASRALELEVESLNARLAQPNLGAEYMDATGGEDRVLKLDDWFSNAGDLQNPTPQFQERLTELRAQAMTYLLNYYQGWSRFMSGHAGDLSFYDAEISWALDAVSNVAGSFAQFCDARDRLIHTWLESFDKYWDRDGDIWLGAGSWQNDVFTSILAVQDKPTQRWKDYADASYPNSLGPIARDLGKSTSPVNRMYGLVAAALSDPQSTATPEACDRNWQAVVALLKATDDNPGKHPRRTRLYAFIAAADAISLLPTGDLSELDRAVQLMTWAAKRKQLLPFVAIDQILSEVDVDSSSPDAVHRWRNALQAMLDLGRDPKRHGMDNNADGVCQDLATALHDLPPENPQASAGNQNTVNPWDAPILLAKAQTLSGIDNLEPRLQPALDRIYFIGSGRNPGDEQQTFIQAFSVPLIGGSPTPLARATVRAMSPPGDDGLRGGDDGEYFLIHGTALDEQNFYASVDGQGIFVFPRDGSPAWRIDSHMGLPSDSTYSLLAANGDLWINCSAGSGEYLVKWNPQKKIASVRVSSIRSDKKSPLDNLPGLNFEFMKYDAPRNRLLLGVETTGSSAFNPGVDDKNGLWELDLSNEKLKQLLSVEAGEVLGDSIGMDDDYLYVASTLWVVKYDLARNKGQYLSFKPGTLSGSYIKQIHLTKDTPRGSGWAQSDNANPGIQQVINNWLWLGSPFSRIAADGKTIEMLNPRPIPDAPALGTVVVSREVGKNRLVIGDLHELVMVTLKNAPSTTKPDHVAQ